MTITTGGPLKQKQENPVALVFVSFALGQDDASYTQFAGEAGACKTSFSIGGCSQLDESVSAEMRTNLRDRIGRTDLVIVLVGKGASENVVAELAVARARNVPFFGVYVNGADAKCELPPDLPRNRTIPWDWDRISLAITQLMREGKHHVFR